MYCLETDHASNECVLAEAKANWIPGKTLAGTTPERTRIVESEDIRGGKVIK
jgi:hypothetical protein